MIFWSYPYTLETVLTLRRFLFIICWLPCLSWSQEDLDESLPLWDYGAALLYLRFAYYPASDQTKIWYLPAPTFEYRGEVVRSTQREGTRAYFIRLQKWSLELGGDGVTEVKSSETFARHDMPDIPWSLQLGPKAVYRNGEGWQFTLGAYQSIITDFRRSETNGILYQSQMSHTWLRDFSKYTSKTTLKVGVEAASQEYLATYFDVRPEDIAVDRPSYESRSGFLSYEISLGQTFKFRKHSFFAIANSQHFDLSANRRSPLHRSDENLSVSIGVTYILGESERRSVPESEAEGLLQKIKFPGLKREAFE